LNGEAELNIISDYAVDMDFGTGAVKVTPAHSQADWNCATSSRRMFTSKTVIGYDLKLNHLTGKYEGLSIKEARPVIAEDMKKRRDVNLCLIYITKIDSNCRAY